MDAQPHRKYAVFISYRHADNKEQGRQWATWLHHTLETYEVPPDLVGRTNLRGEPVSPPPSTPSSAMRKNCQPMPTSPPTSSAR